LFCLVARKAAMQLMLMKKEQWNDNH
jgi:hypothetical protein